MKTGISTFSLDNFDFQVQLNSMLKNNVKPDFIILHYGGIINTGIKILIFMVKTLKQYRLKSAGYIIQSIKTRGKTNPYRQELTEREMNNIRIFLNSVQILKVRGINDNSTIKKIAGLGNTLIVCNSGILKKKVLAQGNAVFLNIHTSKLPQYRGMNNVEWALFEHNDIYVTIHKMSEKMDEGDILYQERIKMENIKLTSIEDYRNYFFLKSNETIGNVIFKLINNEISFKPQTEKGQPVLQYYSMHPVLKNILQERLQHS